MNIIEIGEQIIRQLHELPIESAEEVLDFTMFLKQRRQEKVFSPKSMGTQKRYTIAELGGTEPDLVAPPRRREKSSL
ncbi:MAG: hypothetical protein KJO08_01245 [Gammaproteobacteria bacterium]|nr:hypothetical protein [Gammaproteobacteria bacterium]NNJ83824.1 hypothetical protein [Gammaproteobacteria bacterium]